MGVSLTGSSTQTGFGADAADEELLRTIRVIVADGAQVFAEPSAVPTGNTLVGRDIVVDEDPNGNAGNAGGNNTVIGNDVTIGSGIRDVVSIGRNGAFINESGTVHVGSALHYRGATGALDIADGVVRANSRGGTAQLGRMTDGSACLDLGPAGARVATPIRLGTGDDAEGWSVTLEQSSEATEANERDVQDLVMRGPGGRRIVFCGRQ